MFFTNIILSDLCVFATLLAQFHAKAQRRKVYCHYLDCWYELRAVILYKVEDKLSYIFLAYLDLDNIFVKQLIF